MIVPDLIKAVEAGQEKARLEIQRKHHMNNRIQQLALQAGLKQRIWNSLGKELPMWQEDPDNPGLEKFAELIVGECMTMCDETRADYFKHRKAADDFTDKNIYAEGEAASDIIKYKMKKHFGVEE